MKEQAENPNTTAYNEAAGLPQTLEYPIPDRTVRSVLEVDEHNYCLGGRTHGPGFWVQWKGGPDDHYNAEPEDVLEAVLQRLRFFQRGPAMCLENETAIDHVRTAIRALEMRTERREATGVEGTFAP